MKKRMNIYCTTLITSCLCLLIKENQDAIMWCYNLAKDTVEVDFSTPWETLLILFWSFENTLIVIVGILIVLLMQRINKSIVFDWKNVDMFRLAGKLLVAYFVVSSIKNVIDIYFVQKQSGNPLDFYALSAAFFVLLVAEVFAIGLKLREEQELTI